MSQAMPPERIQFLLAGYVLGDLSGEETQEVAALLAENPSLLAEVAALQAVAEEVQSITVVPPPPQLRSKVLASGQIMPTGLTTKRKQLSWVAIGGAVAAALIAILGLNNYRLWKSLQMARAELSQLDADQATLTYSLTSREASSRATVLLVLNPQTLEAQLTAENLPMLPPEKVYALWTLPEKTVPVTTDMKGAILTGVFRVNAQQVGSAIFTVPAVYRNPEQIVKVAVTVEDAIAPQRHTGSIVLSQAQ
jgi:anti-sigma-K factor RskA